MASKLWLKFANSTADSSGSSVSVNASSGVSYNSSGRFGASYVGNAAGDYIDYANPGNYGATSDFTYVFWLKVTSWGTQVLFDHGPYASGGGVWLYISSSTFYLYFGNAYLAGVTGNISLNTWAHVAVTRTSGTIRLFVNGTQLVTNTVSPGYARTSTYGLRLGNYFGGLSYGSGFEIDDFVFLNDESLYSSAFTPPTSAYTETVNYAPTNITLSATSFNENIAANSTVATISTTDTDSGDTHTYSFVGSSNLWLPLNNSTADAGGNATLNSSSGVSFTTASKFGSHAYTGTGTTSFLKYNNPGSFTSSDDFTYAFWYKPTNSTSYHVVLDDAGSGTAGGGVLVYFYGSTATCYLGNVSIYNASVGTVTVNTWYHVAITRANGVVRFFFDGAVKATVNNTSARTITSPFIVGNYAASAAYGAQFALDDFVYLVGTSLYSAAFTPPTAAYAGSDDNSYFTITGNSLKINSSPDYETKSSYDITIRTTDSASNIYTKDFTLYVNDLSEGPANSAPTNITLSATSFNENIAANTTVATISTTDADSGDTHTYSLVTGTGSTDNSAFNISGSNLRISASPDYETQSSYSIRIRTTDSAGATYEKAFTLTVNDVNEGSGGLATSGALSINDIAGEFGGTTPHALSEYYGAATGVPSTGALAISDFYGKASAPACSPVGQATWTTAGTRTWTRPTGVTEVSVICIGGGGGGGMRDPDKSDQGGGGGGGGGLSYGTFTLPTGINSFTSVTGAGASPVTGDSQDGSNGGESWFGYTLTKSATIYALATSIYVSDTSGLIPGMTISGSSYLAANAAIASISGNIVYLNSWTSNHNQTTATLTFTAKLISGGGGFGGQGGGAASGGSGGTSSGLERDGGGSGGRGGNYSSGSYAGGGGGAGGYSGNGGQGMDSNGTSYSYTGTGGSGGGAGGAGLSYGGGGVGYLGSGTSGAAQSSGIGNVGNAGSGGQSGQTVGSLAGGTGGWSGGGGGGCSALSGDYGGQGGVGVVRIIWGSGRSYPSTLTTDQTTVTC